MFDLVLLIVGTAALISLIFNIVIISKFNNLKKDLEEIDEFVDYMNYRVDPLRFNFLLLLRDRLIEEEQYEEVSRINKILDSEFESGASLKDLI